ncbi:response regulator transcription factor [Vagococcus silagei]|uniref:Response regulator transcription factor n=2 Tax=Vagococcus silagei TaxID=2508885 RepID=A0A4S3B5K2_9ENTE|nr:response regulator transcription factor [Vagococcus silagei]
MNIMVVDDDPLVTGALKTILEVEPDFTVIATGSSAQDAIAGFRIHQPDILLMDIRMGEETGIAAAKKIISEFPTAQILLLTTFLDPEYIHDALKIGVKGYLIKQDFPSIIPAIRAVSSGQTVFGTQIVDTLNTIIQPEKKAAVALKPNDLTDREWDILLKVAEGQNNKEIAASLFLSEGTVRNYISLLLDKLSLRDRTQLAIYYYQIKNN